MLALQVVLLIQLSFVDRTPVLGSPGHAIAGCRIHIQMQDVSRSEHPILYSLLWRFFIYDYFIAVIQMLLGLVRKHALKWLDFEISADGLDGGRHLLVCCLWLNGLSSSLKSIPAGHQGICLFTLGLSTEHKTVTALRWEAIDVRSQLDLDEIFHFQLERVFLEW